METINKTIYDYSIKNRKNEEIPLSKYKGKVLIIVNTATKCGFTSQYTELEKIYEKYNEKGLEIIDIPCNQFQDQAPESDDEIHEFCSLKYKTKFDQMKKCDVNGENEIPLYTFLKEKKGFEGWGYSLKGFGMWIASKLFSSSTKKDNDIHWNFTKFVVDKEGNVVKRFEPTNSMEEVEDCVKKLLE